MDPLSGLSITLVNPGDPTVLPLIRAHLAQSQDVNPDASNHTLGVDALQSGDIRFWSIAEHGKVLGCGALKALPDGAGEVKSVYVSPAACGRGIARVLMSHLIGIARGDGIAALVLETGGSAAYAPARRLYETLGFAYCGPIPGYEPDPNSVFMRLGLDPAG